MQSNNPYRPFFSFAYPPPPLIPPQSFPFPPPPLHHYNPNSQNYEQKVNYNQLCHDRDELLAKIKDSLIHDDGISKDIGISNNDSEQIKKKAKRINVSQLGVPFKRFF